MPTTPGYIHGPLVIPAVVEVKLRWQLPTGRTASNVLHAHNPSATPITSGLADTIQNGINADARTIAYAAVLQQNCTCFGISLKDLNEERLAEFPNTVGGFNGTDASDALPQAVAFAVSLKSAVSGPRGRGRVYLPGWAESSTDANGTMSIASVLLAIGFVQAISDAIFAVGMSLTIANRGHDPYTSPFTGLEVPAQAPGHNDVIAIIAADNVFDSQRRRKV